MARGLCGVKFHVVFVATPNVTFVSHDILQEEERIVLKPKLSHVEFYDAFLHVVHIHVAYAENNIIARLLGINHELVILCIMEFEVIDIQSYPKIGLIPS